MNFLAHQYLSFGREDLQIGNLYGEIVRGRNYENYPDGIKTGILLHRSIDTYTDSHEVVKRSTGLFHKNYGKYSPVIVDVLYDYFLIQNWEMFSDQSFEDFVTDCYALFQREYDHLPENLRYILFHLMKYDWFRSYTQVEGIGRTLYGISQRTKFENNIGEAVHEFQLYQKELNADFLEFFPQIVAHCKNFLTDASQI